jgi:xylulokinase
MYALGIDIGSSSVKTAVVKAYNGEKVFVAQYPETEMPISSPQKDWAEQDPEMWWEAVLKCFEKIDGFDNNILPQTLYIGISYQMHGLVMVDENQNILRPSIIWCDSRAVEVGDMAFKSMGSFYCLNNLLNSPGNFTASKLRWVMKNEFKTYQKMDQWMLPGDFIGMKLTGFVRTTVSGLSEGIFWDFKEDGVSEKIMDEFGFDHTAMADYGNSFMNHGEIDQAVAKKLNLNPKAIISYKAGDQPNNALSLNVLKPGEIAATAGTSGVVYGVVDNLFVDEKQRVNSFAHVNHDSDQRRIGVLLCINGVGISNAWVKRSFGFETYPEMNKEASEIPPGAEGLMFFPFGNGAERMLKNNNIGASVEGLNYNVHHRGHFARAVQEGIAYAFAYGMEAFVEKDIEITVIRAGYANMFLSDLFAQTLADLTGVTIELYDTDGAVGAARGALIGASVLSEEKAFSQLTVIKSYSGLDESPYKALYEEWKAILNKKLG